LLALVGPPPPPPLLPAFPATRFCAIAAILPLPLLLVSSPHGHRLRYAPTKPRTLKTRTLTTQQPFFFWLNSAIWLKEISKWLTICSFLVFWSPHIYSFLKHIARFLYWVLARSQKIWKESYTFVLLYPVYSQIGLKCIKDDRQFSDITIMKKTKPLATHQNQGSKFSLKRISQIYFF
jgi:hypothetical protein